MLGQEGDGAYISDEYPNSDFMKLLKKLFNLLEML